ncbi:MAG: Lipopolysaccharide core heptose(I) kinase RfaP [Planctomycetes bacterium ADurb.Bin412]|nr:MAG: Lipopolysaccharide core heptose(I) kinase RfaP [Planctomycetes bacterium ADurb.Bin412]
MSFGLRRDPKDTARLPHSSTMHTTIDSLHWTCLSGYHTRLFLDQTINWQDLTNHPHARLIKENPLRRVFQITIDQLELYVKIYQPHSIRDWLKWPFRPCPSQTEFDNLQLALSRSLSVSKAIAWAYGYSQHKPIAILITESIGPSSSFEDLLWDDQLPPEHLDQALAAAASVIAKMHCAGILNHDLHAGNILLAPDPSGPAPKFRAYMMDLQKIAIEQRSGHASADPWLPARQKNLAKLFAGLRLRTTPPQQEMFIRAYLRAIQPHRNWTEYEIKKYLTQAHTLADRHLRYIWAKHDRRSLRNSRYARKIQLSHSRFAYVFLQHRHPPAWSAAAQYRFTPQQWATTLADTDALLQPGEFLKQGHRNTVMAKELTVGPHAMTVVVKHSRLSPGFRGFIQSLYRSRATRQWYRAHMLISRDIPTAWPLAAIDREHHMLLKDSILLCEKIPNSCNLRQFILDGNLDKLPHRKRIELAEQTGSLLAQLQRQGLRHRDCKATNILIRPQPEPDQPEPDQQPSFRLFLVDLDGLRTKLPFEIWPSHEAIIRLAVSTQNLPTLKRLDMVRTFNKYLQILDLPEAKDRRARHRLWQTLSLKTLEKAKTHHP